MRKIGIFGGTFDPVHYGHLRIAEEARERFGLAHVLFVPNQVSPFKIGDTTTPASLRVALVRCAIESNPHFSLWAGELEREGPSFTVETLRRLAQEFPADSLYFLTGTDAVRDIGKWREPEACVALAQFVAFYRPGVTESEARVGVPDLIEPKILFAEMNGLDISSTEIRERVAAGRSIRYLVPDPVVALIEQQGLYRPAGHPPV
ncbi:nicotinate-nucleotide adenylyltransferase [Armatimonas rosea]|uniref:Probable nicotinate-nucleotide adenylyltransferase n=1 Tax=Armatimonas rosea TaxID=685828 RepID=A0A7W9STD6_ARMRO|nr:nicotinate-nucleotide adenylyltransferase [Armatimonas rosea]